MDIFDLIRLEFGSLKGFARALGVTSTSVYRWQKEGFPLGKLKKIEEITEGKLTRQMLRPDLFKGE
jgi:DNA-binding transcriptional regulator YdaS (Cro superfamily)